MFGVLRIFDLNVISEGAKAIFMGLGVDIYLFLILLLFVVFAILLKWFLKNNWSSIILSVFLVALAVVVVYVVEPDIVLHALSLLRIAISEFVKSI